MTLTARSRRLRISEWVLVSFFAYICLIAPFFPARPDLGWRPYGVFAAVTAALIVIANLEQGRWSIPITKLRDWLPIVYTLVAFREMELFLPLSYSGQLERGWVRLDRLVLNQWHLRPAVEHFGPAIPIYLEICYLLVYALAPICVAILYLLRKRVLADRFWTIFLAGTLLAYGLFPYFPSQPPRFAFPNLDNPDFNTAIRQLNVSILNKGSIHAGVFPSAHVSSAFACAWAMFVLLPRHKSIGWVLLFYAVSVSVATIYGRYHYTADVIAGFGVSLVAAALATLFASKKKGRER